METGGKAQAIKRLEKELPNLLSTTGVKYKKPAITTRKK